ncbi:MAG TPA: malate dehydrogenase [Oligoflexia bacterium]|nr:malate dehydrogenase [Oligoflexia bacterium]HMP47961.1 malate dehydrogenase [Oligoflexia bacterium]
MKRKKIALIGSGNIGGALAYLALIKQMGDVVLFDVVEGIPQGKALDLSHALPVLSSSCKVSGTNSYQDIEGADVCIVTAGIARKPGMSRDDLLQTNSAIMKDVGKGIRDNAPQSFVIVVSNPLDAMVTLCQQETGFSPNRVVGMAGVLDSARYRSFLAEEIGVSPASVNAMVLGGHGDTMVPVRSHTTINGIPVTTFISSERLDSIEKRVRGAGGEVVQLLKTGSAYFSPATAAIEMAESYLMDQKKVLPCAVKLSGEYGYSGLYIGVPVVIGENGVEKIIEIELSDNEKSGLKESAAAVMELIDALPK